jgi:8-oxo-dGDP phosphatase
VSGYAVESRAEIFEGPVFSVVCDNVRMPDGTVARRDYTRHRDAVAVVALTDDRKVVLIRQYRHPLGTAIWELPAGLLDVDGEPALLAAQRELAEETDLVAESWSELLGVHTSPGFTDEFITIYLATGLSPAPEAHHRVGEEAGIEVERFDLDAAVAMVFRGEITNATAVVGLLAAAAPAHSR